MYIIDEAIKAPCLTKSVISEIIGSNISRLSVLPVPAIEIPTAIQLAYRIWGLKLSIRSFISWGTRSGVLYKINGRASTDAMRTSSDTSETAVCKRIRTALLDPVPQYAIARAYW